MADINVKDMLDSGVHFGHRTSRWNPKMRPYIYGRRNLIHIIDIKETVRGILRGSRYLQKVAESGSLILFVGTKRQAAEPIQEAAEKWPNLREQYSDIALHFIGHLQTNKVKEAVALFDMIETVDSTRLATALAQEMKKQGRMVPCLLQVNTGEEPQKGGVAPKDIPALYAHCAKEGLEIKGLMCIPPEDDVPDFHFALLHKLAGQLDVPVLSMGMSGDFPRAIRYGATHIRIGTALFSVT